MRFTFEIYKFGKLPLESHSVTAFRVEQERPGIETFHHLSQEESKGNRAASRKAESKPEVLGHRSQVKMFQG